MRPSFRIFTCITLTFLLIGAIVCVKMDQWVASTLVDYVQKKTQFTLQIGSFESDILRGSIEFRDVKVKNPNQFPESRFLQINSLRVQWAWTSLFSEKLHLREVVADIYELSGVRNRNGDINIKTFADSFITSQEAIPEKTNVSSEKKTGFIPKQFVIDRLFFQLEKITIADFYDGKHDVKTTQVGIHRVLNNVSQYSQIAIPLTTDLSIFVTGFLLDSILKSTLDSHSYKEVLPKINNSIKTTLEKTKKDVKKTLDKFFKEPAQNTSTPQSTSSVNE